MSITPDGRYALAVPNDGPPRVRVDLLSGEVIELPYGGVVTDDGSVNVVLRTSAGAEPYSIDYAVVAYDTGSGSELHRTPLPRNLGGYFIHGLSGDGRFVGLRGFPSIGGDSSFVLDLTTDVLVRVDAQLAAGSTESGSYGVSPSRDGSTFVLGFAPTRSTDSCSACARMYTWSPAGVEEIRPVLADGGPVDGNQFFGDMSGDGRFVLFTAAGRPFVMHRTTSVADPLAVTLSRSGGPIAVSDDGNVVAVTVDRPAPVSGYVVPEPAIVDRRDGSLTMVVDSPMFLVNRSPLDLTPDGRTLMFTAATFGVNEPSRPGQRYLADLSAPPDDHDRREHHDDNDGGDHHDEHRTSDRDHDDDHRVDVHDGIADNHSGDPDVDHTRPYPTRHPTITAGSARRARRAGRRGAELAAAGVRRSADRLPHPAVPDRGATWVAIDDGIGTGTSATISGLAARHRYHFRIAAANSAGPSPYTAAVSAIAR